MLRASYLAPSALLVSLVASLGCGSPDPAPLDASPRDASVPTDAQTERDAAIDSGHAADGAAVDAGDALDAPIALDAPGEVDADTPDEDASAPGSGSCDARRVLCRALPPECDANEAPSVEGTCWGPCILATECTCATAAECPDVPGYSETCHTGAGHCGPYL